MRYLFCPQCTLCPQRYGGPYSYPPPGYPPPGYGGGPRAYYGRVPTVSLMGSDAYGGYAGVSVADDEHMLLAEGGGEYGLEADGWHGGGDTRGPVATVVHDWTK